MWAVATGVCALAAGAFTISFSSLNDLAVASGIDVQLSFLWPLIVDGFILVATAAAFALKSRGPSVTWYPWAALVLFSAVSVAGNALHAAQVAHVTVPIAVATVVSSVPAVALLVATHLLVVIAGPVRLESSFVDVAAVAGSAVDIPQAPEPENMALVASRLAQMRSSGQAITASVIAEVEGVSVRTGRRRLGVFRERFPELFETSGRDAAGS